MARMWPVDAVIGENGAFYFWMSSGKIRRYFVQDQDTRRRCRIELERIEKEILRHVPQASVSADQSYRESDLAIDFCEDISPCRSNLSSRSPKFFARQVPRQKSAQSMSTAVR